MTPRTWNRFPCSEGKVADIRTPPTFTVAFAKEKFLGSGKTSGSVSRARRQDAHVILLLISIDTIA
jgi:hypothetical protein